MNHPTETDVSPPSLTDAEAMSLALAEGERALAAGEFPVGCVVLYDGRLIVAGAREGTAAGGTNETDHAEMVALRRLERVEPSLDRSRMTLYCTMEPCLMCFGAILLSGVGRLVWAYEDAMGGATGMDRSVLSPLYRDNPIQIVPRFRRRESLALFRRFFENPDNPYWRGSLLARYTLEQALEEDR
jgi:tRNA(adenine34) deaminase